MKDSLSYSYWDSPKTQSFFEDSSWNKESRHHTSPLTIQTDIHTSSTDNSIDWLKSSNNSNKHHVEDYIVDCHNNNRRCLPIHSMGYLCNDTHWDISTFEAPSLLTPSNCTVDFEPITEAMSVLQLTSSRNRSSSSSPLQSYSCLSEETITTPPRCLSDGNINNRIIQQSRLYFMNRKCCQQCVFQYSSFSNVTDMILQDNQPRLNIMKLAKDRKGCQWLLKQIEQESCHLRLNILEECCHHFVSLMSHSVANFLCQRVWKHLTNEQKQSIFEYYPPQIFSQAALNTYATRVIQKMIACTDSFPHSVFFLKQALQSIILELLQDVNGAHVVQQCFLYWTNTENQFIYDAIFLHFLDLATHRQGCCMIQRCIDYASSQQMETIAEKILQYLLQLIHDPFGNYVVQYVLDKRRPKYVQTIIDKLDGHWYAMSLEKFSSNITERCLQLAGDEQRYRIIQQLLADTSMIITLLRDAYGNYVVQKMLQVACIEQRIHLKHIIIENWNILGHFRYGKRIQQNLERLLFIEDSSSVMETKRDSVLFWEK
eukprot:jgi/Galph1/4278/GphlegSOOS_G2907.1